MEDDIVIALQESSITILLTDDLLLLFPVPGGRSGQLPCADITYLH